MGNIIDVVQLFVAKPYDPTKYYDGPIPYPQEPMMPNIERREQVWYDLPWYVRVIFGIPFHIVNYIISDIEHDFFPQCPWCGRQFPTQAKAKECCAFYKKTRGRSRYSPSYTFSAGGGGYTADSSGTRARDDRGNVYEKVDKY